MSKVSKSKGFTLLELMLVLGLIAVIAIAAFVIFPKVRTSNQAQSETSNLTTIVGGVKILYGGDYSEISDATVISGRVYPSGMLDSVGTSAKSSFGQAVHVDLDTVGPAGGTSDPEHFFDTTYEGVPSEACIRLGSGVARNFSNVAVQGSSVFKVVSSGLYQVDINKITQQCNSAAKVTMVFVSE